MDLACIDCMILNMKKTSAPTSFCVMLVVCWSYFSLELGRASYFSSHVLSLKFVGLEEKIYLTNKSKRKAKRLAALACMRACRSVVGGLGFICCPNFVQTVDCPVDKYCLKRGSGSLMLLFVDNDFVFTGAY